MDEIDPVPLLRAAAEAATRAYAPYSRFRVGAALLTRTGRVFTACNVENASYGLTICAERAAVFRAVAEGELDFETLALCVPGGGTPCGACRQVLHEFSPGLRILIGDSEARLLAEYLLRDLLPEPFQAETLSSR